MSLSTSSARPTESWTNPPLSVTRRSRLFLASAAASGADRIATKATVSNHRAFMGDSARGNKEGTGVKLRESRLHGESRLAAAEGSAGLRTGVLAARFQHRRAIHDHPFDAHVVSERLVVSRAVLHGGRIEESHIGISARVQDAAVGEAELGGIQRCHLANRV